MYLDAAQLSFESMARTAAILSVLIVLLFSSLTSIYVILTSPALNEATGFYMISLSIADLFWASLIVPLSIYSTLNPNWNFNGDGSLLCKCSAYLQIVIMTSTMFTFGWISVDRYSAFMKPSRYESEKKTRCLCWIAFTWLTALLSALPVVVAKMEANYYHEFEFCVLDLSSAAAYSITLAVLVLIPSLCTIIFTTFAICNAMRRPAELEDIQRTVLETDQNFIVSIFVIITFILSWLPIVAVHFLPETLIHPEDTVTMKFAFIWLAIGGSSSKWLIYMFTHKDFRNRLCCRNETDTATRTSCCFQLCSSNDRHFDEPNLRQSLVNCQTPVQPFLSVNNRDNFRNEYGSIPPNKQLLIHSLTQRFLQNSLGPNGEEMLSPASALLTIFCATIVVTQLNAFDASSFTMDLEGDRAIRSIIDSDAPTFILHPFADSPRYQRYGRIGQRVRRNNAEVVNHILKNFGTLDRLGDVGK